MGERSLGYSQALCCKGTIPAVVKQSLANQLRFIITNRLAQIMDLTQRAAGFWCVIGLKALGIRLLPISLTLA